MEAGTRRCLTINGQSIRPTRIPVVYYRHMTEEEFVKWAEERIEHYMGVLSIQRHRIVFEPRKTPCQPGEVMCISLMYPYVSNIIQYNWQMVESMLKDGIQEEVEYSIIHELIHIVLNPLWHVARERYTTEDAVREANEQCTDHLATIIGQLCIKKP